MRVLAELDWVNGVVLPLVMTFTVNLFLAVYGSWVLARWLSFSQIMTNAALEYGSLRGRLLLTRNVIEAEYQLSGLLDDPVSALAYEKQANAAKVLTELAEKKAGRIRNQLEEFSGAESPSVVSDKGEEEWRVLIFSTIASDQSSQVAELVSIKSIKPDLFSVLGIVGVGKKLRAANLFITRTGIYFETGNTFADQIRHESAIAKIRASGINSIF